MNRTGLSIHAPPSLGVLSFVVAFSFCCATTAQTTFTDDFERPDGPVDGWTVYQGNWQIAGGRMTTTSVNPASWIWAGDVPILTTGDLDVRATVTFPSTPGDAVGRHGGFMFFASVATQRNDPAMNGYTIDWIDRAADHGFRLLRFDGGVQSALAVGTPDIAEPPEQWWIEVVDENIRFYADDELIFDVFDDTYREGHFGAWAHTNRTEMAIDDLEIEFTPVLVDACMTASATSGGAPLRVDFDASCSSAVNGIESYEWDFGDGGSATGVSVSHTYEFADNYIATLTVVDAMGNTDTTEVTIGVFEVARGFSDDFERADGPVDGWTAFQGEWSIFDGTLTTMTGGQEHWIWAGDPAVAFPENFELTLDLAFVDQPPDGVGRHGGIMFCAVDSSIRWQTSGYTIDWIDRVDDHGFRFIRSDNGTHTGARRFGTDLIDPPTNWRVVVEGATIRFFGDDELLLETQDDTYRGGFLGIWGYSNGQSMAIDNVSVTSPDVVACFTISPGAKAPAGSDLIFDAGCSLSGDLQITSHSWDFGDGETGSGAVVEHTYAEAGFYTVKLSIDFSDGSTVTTERTVEIFESTNSFADDFSRDDGPPDGWTITSGDWSILDEQLVVDVPAAPEAWIWAGEPPVRFSDVEAVEFTLEFLAQPPDAVGRHGGVFLFGQTTDPRFSGNSGYSFDWIDRATDQGYRFSVWNEGVETHHIAGTFDVEPGTVWRVEFEGDTITLLADDEIKGEVIDGTYRSGHIGFWSYFNGQRFAVDDVVIGDDPGPVPDQFSRADANADGDLNITDGIFVLNFLFNGGPTPTCMDAADANDDGAVNITDGIYTLNFLFTGGPDPRAPFPGCGTDGTEDPLDCAAFEPCE